MPATRVNLSATVPPDCKAAVEGIAELERNTASRIIQKAIEAYIDTYKTAHPEADLEAAAERYADRQRG